MPVNLRNEKALNQYIENLVYHGEKHEALKPAELQDKAFVGENKDKIISAMIYQWMKMRVREHLTESSEVPYLEPVTAADEKDPVWLKAALAEGRPVYDFNAEEISEGFYNKLNAIRDCFYSSCLDYLDKELSKPKVKLKVDYLKTVHDYDSFEKAVIAANKWHEGLAQAAQKQTFKEEDRRRMENGTEFVMDLGDGFKAVKLLTPEALDAESDKMGHCVGQGGYDRAVKSNAIQIYSIRDEKGEPHVTFEIQNNLVKQCKGKADKLVIKKYLPYVQKFINRMGLNPYDDAKNMGMVKDISGKFINMYEMPEGAHFKNLDLSNTEVSVLPKGVIVDGYADLSGTRLKSLPEDLKVGKNLSINDTGIESLPFGFSVGGSLSAKRSALKALPEGLRTGGSLDVSDTKVSSFPRTFSIGKDIDISRTEIRDIPSDLKVNGDFSFVNTRIDFLPEKLEVAGSMNAERSDIGSYPAGVKVGKDLNLRETAVEKLPDGLKVNGSLFLTHSQISELPEGLEVKDSLLLCGLYISRLPGNFKTGGDLDISGTRIHSLPQGLDVGGSLNMRGSSATEIPSDLKVGKDLKLGSSYIEKLPDNFTVGRNLDLSYSSIRELPKGLKVGGILDISSTSLKEIPTGTKADGFIRAGNSDVAYIAPDIDSKKIKGLSPEKVKEAKLAYRKRAAQQEIRLKKTQKSRTSASVRFGIKGSGRE